MVEFFKNIHEIRKMTKQEIKARLSESDNFEYLNLDAGLAYNLTQKDLIWVSRAIKDLATIYCDEDLAYVEYYADTHSNLNVPIDLVIKEHYYVPGESY